MNTQHGYGDSYHHNHYNETSGCGAMSVDRLVQMAQRVAFAVVVLAPVLASWHGLVAVGHQWLDLGIWAPLVPLTLDAAALYAAVLSWSATLEGDAAGVDRLLVWVYAGLSAGLNVWHADAIGGIRAAVFYGVASLSAAALWERTLRAVRRRELRELGAIDNPAPHFRVARWVLHMRETWGAWRLAIGEGIPDGRQALAMYRGQASAPVPEASEAVAPAPVDATAPAPEPSPSVAVEVAPELDGLTVKQAMATAFDAIGVDPATDAVVPAREWLAGRGLEVDPSGAYKAAKRLQAESAPRRLMAVGEDQ